jgi:hypothetical protein
LAWKPLTEPRIKPENLQEYDKCLFAAHIRQPVTLRVSIEEVIGSEEGRRKLLDKVRTSMFLQN